MKKREKSAVLKLIASIFSVGVASLLPFIVRIVLVFYVVDGTSYDVGFPE